jgi:hypothetical protein
MLMALAPPQVSLLFPAHARLQLLDEMTPDADEMTLPARHWDAYSSPKYLRFNVWACCAHWSTVILPEFTNSAVSAREGEVSL